MARDVNLQIHKAKCMSNMINPLKSMPRHIIMNLLKTKNQENTLKGARKKNHIFLIGGKTVRMVVGFSSETTQVRWKGCSVFQELKGKNC